MAIDAALVSRVREFIADDPDARDRDELEALLDRNDDDAEAGLRARFAEPLQFGTAGLRGPLQSGPAGMNTWTVARATAGLCARLLQDVPNAAERGVCIGFDARHRSREFAEETAAVAAGAGFRVQLFDEPVPTPTLAFALLDQNAAGGVMVTASHNPKDDNGFKVYWHNGAQIVPPTDAAIAAAMDAIPSIRTLPRTPREERLAAGRQSALGAEIEQRYLDSVRGLLGDDYEPGADLGIAYTAMHGVGQRFMEPALAAAGFTRVHSVEAQADPDPDFPTAAFPNPEEDGAMDLVLALGNAEGADLVLANDPDADRLAVASRHEGRLLPLTGNEVGALLADDLLRRCAPELGPRALVLNSIVSSPLAGRIARAHGAHHEDTLTGFKWICNRSLELEASDGKVFVFGFEEALGYSASPAVRDKDGIAAAVVTARMAADARAADETLHDRLHALWRQHGVHLSGQVSLRLDGSDGTARRSALMAKLREAAPEEIAGLPVDRIVDLATGESGLPKTDAIFMHLGEQRVAVRPSGTEPKLKLYLDVCEPVADDGLDAARERAGTLRDALAAALRELLS